MNQKYIDGMNEIKADNDLKRKIINSVKQNNSKKLPNLFSKRKTAIIAAACIFTLVISFCIPYIHTKNQEANALFNKLVITAYAADGTPIEVKPNVEFPFGKYSIAINCVPGFPIKIACNDVDTFKLTATDGSFILWEPSDGQIKDIGKELEIKSGDTVYWRPINPDSDDLAADCTILIKAYKSSKELGRTTIKIESGENFIYTGRLAE